MKQVTVLLFFVAFLFVGHSCKNECEYENETCLETPPTDEACLAFFQRWFFNEDTNNCEEVGYSGCSQKGFATKEECLSCSCD